MSPPQRIDQVIFSTSSPIEDVTAELPMFALIFTRKLRPMIIGSVSGWLMFAGMIARPRATSSRTNSGRDSARERRAERLARVLPRQELGQLQAGRAARAQAFDVLAPAQVLADRDELHLRRDDAAARVVHLRDVHARPSRGAACASGRSASPRAPGPRGALGRTPRSGRRAARCRRVPRSTAHAAARGRRECRSCTAGIGVRAGRVVDVDRRVLLRAERGGRVGLRDLAHRHPDIGARALDVDLARAR